MLKFTPFPTWVSYSDDIPEGVGGYAKLFYTRLRKKYKDKDVGIHKHEYLHVTQFYVLLLVWVALCSVGAALAGAQYYQLALGMMPWGLSIHPLLYTKVKKYKLACEVACYKEQAKWYENDRRPLFARFIAEDYGLDISVDEALSALKQ